MTTGSLDFVKELRERTGAGMMDCKAALKEADGNIEKAIDILRKKGMAQAAKRAGREAKEGLVAIRVQGKKAAIVEVNCETDFVARTEDFKSLTTLALDETMTLGEKSLASDTLSKRIAELSGKIGEKMLVRRAKFVESKDGVLYSYVHSNNKLGVVVELGTNGAPSANAGLDELGKNLAMQVAASNPLCVARSEMPASVIEREKAIYREEVKGKPDAIVEKIIQGKFEKFYQVNCLLEQPFIKDDKISVTKLIEEAGKKIGSSIQIKRFVRIQLGEAIPS